jgi:hypothetical protein
MQVLDKTLTILEDNGYTINGEKSHFAVSDLEYLGYEISTQGTKPSSKKVKAILSVKSPKTKRQLKRFIGMVNYYRDTFRFRSHLMSKLTEMTSPKKPFKWTSEHEGSFQKIKQAMAKCNDGECSWRSLHQKSGILKELKMFQQMP